MPDYVYALHDFLPEHEDEVPFRQGERIEVVERDDLYSDGWWQVSPILQCIVSSQLPPGGHAHNCLYEHRRSFLAQLQSQLLRLYILWDICLIYTLFSRVVI